jgi:hypothetical protein
MTIHHQLGRPFDKLQAIAVLCKTCGLQRGDNQALILHIEFLGFHEFATATAVAAGSGDWSGIMVYPLKAGNGAGFWPTATPKAAP